MRRRGGALERRMRRGTKAGEVQCLVAEGGNGEGLRRWVRMFVGGQRRAVSALAQVTAAAAILH
jgi:hypothetical protein